MDRTITTIGIAALPVGAGLWLWGSLVEVPDNSDTIVGELQRIGRLNAGAAAASCVAALCAAYAFWRQKS
jgi:hypothetical protein